MEQYADAIVETTHGVVITLDVTAGAKRSLFPAGYNTWRKSIRCQVAAPAVDGKANRAIIDIVAGILGVPRADVVIISGHTSTSKTVAVAGQSRSDVIACLNAAGA